jgi:hypothetical protein
LQKTTIRLQLLFQRLTMTGKGNILLPTVIFNLELLIFICV